MFAKQQSGLSIVLVTWFPYEADLARARLEAGGIEAWVLDAEQVRMQWHVAGAIGGVKVGVHPDDADCARAVLARDDSSALDESDETDAAPPAEVEARCHRCGSGALRERRASERPGAFGWLVMTAFFALGLLVPWRQRRVALVCDACDASAREPID
jgi:hypothetical protein